jgi:hypothetical protein
MKTLTNSELFDLFTAATTTHFKKRGRYLMRPAIIGETILTIVVGKLETMITVSEDSVVLRNILIGSSAETYVIKRDAFDKRYEIEEGKNYTIDGVFWNVAHAKGEIDAFMYTGDPIKFVASWGEEMLCEEGDYIARPKGSTPNDIYRIEKQAFAQTYSPVS